MRQTHLLAIAALVSVGLMAGLAPASAAGAGSSALPLKGIAEADVVKVHGWHCRELWAPGWGWHRNWGACGYGYGYYGPSLYWWYGHHHHHGGHPGGGHHGGGHHMGGHHGGGHHMGGHHGGGHHGGHHGGHGGHGGHG